MSDHTRFEVSSPPLQSSNAQAERFQQDAYGRPPLSSAQLNKEIAQSEKYLSDAMHSKLPVNEYNAGIMVINELTRLNGFANASQLQSRFLEAITTQNDKLKSQGFPSLTLEENGERLTVRSEGGNAWISQLDWLKENPGKRNLTADALQQKPDNTPVSGDTAAPGDGAGALHGNGTTKPFELNAKESQQVAPQNPGDAQYHSAYDNPPLSGNAQQQSLDGHVQQQSGWHYERLQNLSSEDIRLQAHEQDLRRGDEWWNIAPLYPGASQQFHALFGHADRGRDGQVHFHVKQLSRYDAAHAPGRPVAVPPNGSEWDIMLQRMQDVPQQQPPSGF